MRDNTGRAGSELMRQRMAALVARQHAELAPALQAAVAVFTQVLPAAHAASAEQGCQVQNANIQKCIDPSEVVVLRC